MKTHLFLCIFLGVTIATSGAEGNAPAFVIRDGDTFICNAGIYHPKSADVCTGPSSSGLDPDTSICSDTSGPRDLMVVDIQRAEGNSFVNEQRVSLWASQVKFQEALPNNSSADRMVKRISGLNFELHSETYGTQYFIDICYIPENVQSPPPTPTPKAEEVIPSRLFLSAEVAQSNLGPDSYSKLAFLTIEQSLTCRYLNRQEIVVESVPMALQSRILATYAQFSISDLFPESPVMCRIRYIFRENNSAVIRNSKARPSIITLITNFFMN